MGDKNLAEVTERIGQLVKLANDEGAAENERRNAALKAVTLIGEHDLAVVSQSDLDAARKAVEGSTAMIAAAKKQATQNLMLGGILGWLVKGKV